MNHPYKAYRRASHTVGKTRQIVMLYDGTIRFLQQAIEAIEQKDYETRYHKLTRATDILVGLQACLDFDAGGDSARTLYDFYSSIELRLFNIHRSNDITECQDIIARLKEMRDVWDRIDRAEESQANTPEAAPVAEKFAAGGSDSITVSA